MPALRQQMEGASQPPRQPVGQPIRRRSAQQPPVAPPPGAQPQGPMGPMPPQQLPPTPLIADPMKQPPHAYGGGMTAGLGNGAPNPNGGIMAALAALVKGNANPQTT